jgi:ZIP family zinc transporter
MNNFGASAGWGLAVAASLVVGALAAAGLQLPPRVAATLTAFGGGILLAAVAVELVPEADEQAGRWVTAGGLLAGTLLYIGADAWLTRNERLRQLRHSTHAAMVGQPMSGTPAVGEAARGEAIAAGIFVDGVPESIALVLTVAAGQIGVALLAAGRSRGVAVGLLAGIGLALAGATVLGGTVLADASPALIGGAEALAAGAVLAVVSVSIIPYAFSEVSSMVAAAAVVGFIGGYLLS